MTSDPVRSVQGPAPEPARVPADEEAIWRGLLTGTDPGELFILRNAGKKKLRAGG